MEAIADITINKSEYETGRIVIDQDDDRIVVEREDIDEFAAAIRKHTPTIEEPETTPEKWYVVLKNSNSRALNSTKDPMTFSVYADARIYGGRMGDLERTYVPISVDEYKRTFGR